MIASYDQVIDNMVAMNGYYDIVWSGVCILDGRFYTFRTVDLTDYQKMNDTCPCCSIEDLDRPCHCENYKAIFCVLEKIGYESDRCRLKVTRKAIK